MQRFSAQMMWITGAALVLAGCASQAPSALPTAHVPPAKAADVLVITGSLGVPAKALPSARSGAVVELRDISAPDGLVVAEARLVLPSQPLPTPFTLTVERAALGKGKAYAVQGAILDGDVAHWVTQPTPIDPKAARIDLGVLPLEPFQAMAFASTLRCGKQEIQIGFMGDMMLLVVDGQTWELQQVTAIQGATRGTKFQSTRDPSTTVSTIEDTTRVVLQGQPFPTCVGAAASGLKKGATPPTTRPRVVRKVAP